MSTTLTALNVLATAVKNSDALDSCKVESNDVHRIEQKSDNNYNEQAGRHATVEKESK